MASRAPSPSLPGEQRGKRQRARELMASTAIQRLGQAVSYELPLLASRLARMAEEIIAGSMTLDDAAQAMQRASAHHQTEAIKVSGTRDAHVHWLGCHIARAAYTLLHLGDE